VTDRIDREALAVIALSYVGRGDIHEQVWLDTLCPPQANPVDGKGKPLSWCGAFALMCIREWYRNKYATEPPDDWIWVTGRGFEYPLELPIRRLPKVGSVAYRNRNQHRAVVTSIPGDGTVVTVDGNSFDGKHYGVVALHEGTQLGEWDAFFDVEKMLCQRPGAEG
jgi:hypothetical protein